MRTWVTVTSLAMASMLAGCGAATSVDAERGAIATLVQGRYGVEGTAVDPIVVRGDYAVAGWTHDENGGRTLLHKEKGRWRSVVTAGVEARDAEFLVKAGMPESEAKALANVLIAAERRIPETRLAQLDRSDVQR